MTKPIVSISSPLRSSSPPPDTPSLVNNPTFATTTKPRKPTFHKSHLFLLTMTSVFFFTVLSLLLFISLSSSHEHHHRISPIPIPSLSTQTEIQQACNATRNPQACEISLSHSNQVPPNPTPLQIIQSAFWVSSQNLKTAQTMVKSILDASAGNQNRTNAANTCLQVLSMSEARTSSANDSLPRGRIKDARAWMSAGLAYQYDCWSGLKYVNDTGMVNETMSFLDSLIGFSSNALSMVMAYDNLGNKTASWWAPRTERDGFWEVSGNDGAQLGFNGGVPSKLTADVTVCAAGCTYQTVQDAVNASPANNDGTRRFVIYIKEGVYEETVRVPFEKKNVVFLGDGMGKTVITGSLNVGLLGVTTYNSATVGVLGDGFMASGLTIQNTAGPGANQAVAFRSDSDLSIIENCEFLGNQDTLYVHSLRQFYKSCRIQGNVDFIFGNSATIFRDCQILVAPRQVKPEKGENNAITAHGRTDPAQSTGFVFQNCLINGTEEYMKLYRSKPQVHNNFLGRPWKEYSRTVFTNCNLEALINPDGWMPWSGDFALKTLYYGEFQNSGPGSDVSKRVSWSSQIPAEHVDTYSVQNFIQGDQWIPTSL
ncbi:Pectinesterase domain-containing protein/PMEI domain-containing protein [Cephalotus follicularis]|uniref:pectinesterase n=1 Tax=Cephalotus follicularis TaxID=3775 RepID=A0A1Q3AM54_CEPFO|nr:Pectinesterase domain-containing protein/PMEI domain-containing protein [Cephalotus follicularis]